MTAANRRKTPWSSRNSRMGSERARERESGRAGEWESGGYLLSVSLSSHLPAALSPLSRSPALSLSRPPSYNILSNFQSPALTPHTLPKKSLSQRIFPAIVIDLPM